MPDWLNNFEHASVTAENKESFTKAMGKYETEGDAIVGGYNAQKMAGAPYKLPESMDKLADDNARGEFRTGALKVLGMEPAADVEAYADLNMKVGMAEGVEVDVDLANMLKTVAVEKKWPKSLTQDIVELHNTVQAKARAATAEKNLTDMEAAAKKCREELIADPDIGSEEELLRRTELFARAFENHLDLNADEAKEVGDALAESPYLTRSKILAKILLNHFYPLAEEGETPAGGAGGGGGGGETEQTPFQWKQLRWPKSKEMWGKEDDKWENESPDNRKRAGRKE